MTMLAQTGETPVPKNKPAYADVYYTDAKDERQSLDIYLPRQSDELAPVIVYIHGGAWTVGGKADVGQNSYPQCSHAWCAARGRECLILPCVYYLSGCKVRHNFPISRVLFF